MVTDSQTISPHWSGPEIPLHFVERLSLWPQTDEAAAREEARRSVSSGSVSYAKADVVVKLGGWDPEYTRAVAQGCLVALKQLTLADKKLAGTICCKKINKHADQHCRVLTACMLVCVI